MHHHHDDDGSGSVYSTNANFPIQAIARLSISPGIIYNHPLNVNDRYALLLLLLLLLLLMPLLLLLLLPYYTMPPLLPLPPLPLLPLPLLPLPPLPLLPLLLLLILILLLLRLQITATVSHVNGTLLDDGGIPLKLSGLVTDASVQTARVPSHDPYDNTTSSYTSVSNIDINTDEK